MARSEDTGGFMPLEKTISPHGWSESRKYAELSPFELITGVLLAIPRIDRFTQRSLTAFLVEGDALSKRNLRAVTQREVSETLLLMKALHALNAIETNGSEKAYCLGQFMDVLFLRLSFNGVLRTHEDVFQQLATEFMRVLR